MGFLKYLSAEVRPPLATILCEISEEVAHAVDMKGVPDETPGACCADKACTVQLFKMKGRCGRRRPYGFGDVPGGQAARSLSDEKAENAKSLRMGQCSEAGGGLGIVHTFIIQQILKCPSHAVFARRPHAERSSLLLHVFNEKGSLTRANLEWLRGA